MRRVSFFLVPVFVLALVGLVGPTQAAHASSSCSIGQTGTPNVMVTYARGNYVSAELGWTGNNYGRLRNRPSYGNIGTWEQFRFICLDWENSIYAIQSHGSGRYVSAELAWTLDDKGLLRARSTSIGPWERFKLVVLDSSLSKVAIQSTANGLFVSAEIGWSGDRSGLLRARSAVIGPWEQYRIL